MLTEANQHPGCTGSWPQHYYRIWRQSHTLGGGGDMCTEKCTCLHCHISQGGETGFPYVQSISFHSSYLDVRESWNLYEMSSRNHLQRTQFNKTHHFLSIDNNRNLENWSRYRHPWSVDKKPAKGILPQCTTLKLQTLSISGQDWQLCQDSQLCTIPRLLVSVLQKTILTKLQFLPTPFRVCTQCVCEYNTYITHIYYTHALTCTYELHEVYIKRFFSISTECKKPINLMKNNLSSLP